MVYAMRKNVVGFPDTPTSKQSGAEERSRVRITVGGERFLIDVCGTVTEINPVGAPIVPIEQRSSRRKRRRPAVPK